MQLWTAVRHHSNGNCTITLPRIEQSGAEQWLISLRRHIFFYSELINPYVPAAFQSRHAMSAKLPTNYQRTATVVLGVGTARPRGSCIFTEAIAELMLYTVVL